MHLNVVLLLFRMVLVVIPIDISAWLLYVPISLDHEIFMKMVQEVAESQWNVDENKDPSVAAVLLENLSVEDEDEEPASSTWGRLLFQYHLIVPVDLVSLLVGFFFLPPISWYILPGSIVSG